MPQKPQNTISLTKLKHYNKFISVRTEALIWVKMTTDTGIKLKVDTTENETYQQLLESTTIDVLKIEQQHPSSQDIITLTMNPNINSYFNKHPML